MFTQPATNAADPDVLSRSGKVMKKLDQDSVNATQHKSLGG
jgi:hypothetical protein